MTNNLPAMNDNNGQLQATNSVTAIAISREVQEVQGLILAAKNFPRQVPQAMNRIVEACKDKELAEVARYEYPKGTTRVTGPSIRLAEVLAQNWGNLDFGWRVLRSDADESEVQAVCWDLETNVRQTRVFSVPHMRHTRKGSYKLTDPRDIYEMQANQAARRMRACILAIIPAGVKRAAEEQCDRTLANQLNSEGKTMSKDQRLAAILETFAPYGVEQEDIERLFKHKFSAISETEIARLKRIALSLRDHVGSKDEFFPPEEYEPKKPDAKQPQTEPTNTHVQTQNNDEAIQIYLKTIGDAMGIGIKMDFIADLTKIDSSQIKNLPESDIYEAIDKIRTVIDSMNEPDPDKTAKKQEQDTTPDEGSNLDPKSKLDASDGVHRVSVKAYDMLLKMDSKASEYLPQVHDIICQLYYKDLRLGDDVKIAQLVRQAQKGKKTDLDKLQEFVDSRGSLVE